MRNEVRDVGIRSLGMLAALGGTVVGCTSDTATGWAGAVDTLANGAVVVSNPAEGLWESDPDAAWSLTPVLRLGSTAGEGPEVFGTVKDVVVDGFDRIYVLDYPLPAIRVFDSDGSFVRTIGRSGDGPGELARVNALRIAPTLDSIWAVDIRHFRYEIFDTSGVWHRAVQRNLPSYAWYPPGFVRSNGRYAAQFLSRNEAGERRSVLGEFDASGDSLVTLALYPYPTAPANIFDFQDSQGIGTIMGVPFSGTLHVWTDPTGHFRFGHGDTYEIVKRNFAGDTVQVIRKESTPVPVPTDRRAAALENLEEYRGHPNYDPDRVPDHFESFVEIGEDPRGNVWVLRHAPAEGYAFDIFNSEGRFLGAISIDERPALNGQPVVFTDDAVYLVTADDFDVNHVVKFQVDRP